MLQEETQLDPSVERNFFDSLKQVETHNLLKLYLLIESQELMQIQSIWLFLLTYGHVDELASSHMWYWIPLMLESFWYKQDSSHCWLSLLMERAELPAASSHVASQS